MFEECKQFRPTYLNAFPYIYEKAYRSLMERGQLDVDGALAQLFGGRIQVANCGGAPIADHVFAYYCAQDFPLVVGYGLTETAPVLTSPRLDDVRPGSVGPAVPGVELKIAADGEVCARGPNVMIGYYRNPRATREVLRDGWFCTGDLGRLDRDGHLYLVGRKKEMIITSGGRNIPPGPIEDRINAEPLVLQSLLVGDRRDYLVALVVPDADAWLNEVGRALGDQGDCWAEAHHTLWQRIQVRLRDLSKYEQVQKIHLLREPFSIENGLMTAKQSLRRFEIVNRYRNEIDAMYKPSAETDLPGVVVPPQGPVADT